MGHAGEVLQGGLRWNGGVTPFLVTLPMPGFLSVATVQPAKEWRVTPVWKTKALRAAELAADGACALAVTMESEIPVGRGCGSSTADCVAAVRAVGDLLNLRLGPEEVAAVVHKAELASDSTMFDLAPVAFLSREGTVFRRLGDTWPAMEIAVVDMGGPSVDTDACAVPAYTGEELDEFVALLDELEHAIRDGNVARIARVSLRSATIQQRYRPHAGWATVVERARENGADGVAIAHSGTVAAVIGKGVCSGDPVSGRR